jgi:Protein of unknown function (DUF2946)
VSSTFAERRTGEQRLAWLLLPALLLRVLIPLGFMPAHEAPFSLEICPDGFPTQLLSHPAHHHDHGGGGRAHSEHCVFGTAGGGPLSQSAACGARPAQLPVVAPPPPRPVIFVRLVHLPEPRGPPAA